MSTSRVDLNILTVVVCRHSSFSLSLLVLFFFQLHPVFFAVSERKLRHEFCYFTPCRLLRLPQGDKELKTNAMFFLTFCHQIITRTPFPQIMCNMKRQAYHAKPVDLLLLLSCLHAIIWKRNLHKPGPMQNATNRRLLKEICVTNMMKTSIKRKDSSVKACPLFYFHKTQVQNAQYCYQSLLKRKKTWKTYTIYSGSNLIHFFVMMRNYVDLITCPDAC